MYIEMSRQTRTGSSSPPDDGNYDSYHDQSRTDTATTDPASSEGHASDQPALPLPRFMQDMQGESASNRWQWVPYPLRKPALSVVRWVVGPPIPKRWTITPFFPSIQEAPLRFMNKYLPKRSHRIALYLFWISMWIISFALVMWKGLGASEIPGYDTPNSVSCGAAYWTPDNGCGLDGMDCRPFDDSSFAFQCPANCESYHVLNPYAVGAQEVIYQPYVIGGPSDGAGGNGTYRGDSFLCGSAIHAGVISNSAGGCGVVRKTGQSQSYEGTTRNGISSIPFDSYFPLSFEFVDVECHSQDPRWSLLAISIVFSTMLALFTNDPGTFFFTVFIGAFWQTGLASDPPDSSSTLELFTDIMGKFLPAMFCAWVIFDKMGVRRTLKDLKAQFEKAILWLGGCWVGALSNYTFEKIPIQRLTGHDLEQQPGAKAALAVIVIVLFCIVVGQIWCYRQEGRLIKFLQLYGLLLLGIIICLVIPSLNLRIHHYIVALLFLPGTGLQTRPSLLYQGILVGLFANGIARWGFDSILQTSEDLQGDAQLGSALPELLPPIINATLSTITFHWQDPPEAKYDGLSILVNDVERFRGYRDEPSSLEFVWERDYNATTNTNEYFRFGYMRGTSTLDYTKAGIWDGQQNWTHMEAGPSKIKRAVVDWDTLPRDFS